MSVATFGPEFTDTLLRGCARMCVPPELPLATIARECDFNPLARNPSGAAGLFQRMPYKRPDGTKIPYDTSLPPHIQLHDAFSFWMAQCATFRVRGPFTLGGFYCLNLAPARMANGPHSEARVIYSSRKDIHPAEWTNKGEAYEQNKLLDPVRADGTRKGWITLGDLGASVAKAVRKNQARYDAELQAAYTANVRPT